MELSQAEYLRQRYGGHANDRRAVWIVAGLLIAVAIAWFAWQAVALRQPTVTAEGLALDVVSETEAEVTIPVTTTPRGGVAWAGRAR